MYFSAQNILITVCSIAVAYFKKVILLHSWPRAGNRYEQGLIENLAPSFDFLRRTMHLIVGAIFANVLFRSEYINYGM